MDDATSLGSRRMYSDEFAAIVQQVLASLPPPRLGPGTDLDAAAAELVERLSAVYPYPRQRGLIGFRAVIDAYGADSRIGRSARLQMGLYLFGLRHRAAEARGEVVAA